MPHVGLYLQLILPQLQSNQQVLGQTTIVNQYACIHALSSLVCQQAADQSVYNRTACSTTLSHGLCQSSGRAAGLGSHNTRTAD
jgi:hypothetical protein